MSSPSLSRIESQASLSIDIGDLLNSNALSAEEKDLVAAAKKGAPNLLELSDFAYDPTLPTTDPKNLARAKNFTDYRLKVITRLVQEKAGGVFTQWPEITPAIFSALVHQESQGVLNVSAMLDALIPALLMQNQVNGKGAMIFAKSWMILYATGQAHKNWVHAGHAPILPEGNFDNFIHTSLENLASDKIKFGILADTQSDDVGASYDSARDYILYPINIYADPLMAVDRHQAPLPLIVTHEFWHSWQDDIGAPLPIGQFETEAEIISLKALILHAGSESAQQSVKNIADDRDAVRISRFSPYLTQATPKKIVAELMMNPQSELAQSFYNVRSKLFEAALSEMNDEQIDPAKRAALAHLYMVSKTIGLMLQAMDYFQKKYEMDPQSIANPKMAVTQENMTNMVTHFDGYVPGADYTAVIQTCLEIFSGMREFYLLYDPQNEGPAKDYLLQTYLPKVFGSIADTYGKFQYPTDGIGE